MDFCFLERLVTYCYFFRGSSTKLLFMTRIIISLALIFTLPSLALAQSSATFGSLKKNKVNVRIGPGTQYPIIWVYQRYMYPVKILNEYQNWYKIQDTEGEQGWVYKGLISSRRTTLVNEGDPAILYKESDGRIPLYKLEPGVILGLNQCGAYMCEVKLDRTKGWVEKSRLEMLGDS